MGMADRLRGRPRWPSYRRGGLEEGRRRWTATRQGPRAAGARPPGGHVDGRDRVADDGPVGGPTTSPRWRALGAWTGRNGLRRWRARCETREKKEGVVFNNL
jgi:hypothetical protein